MTSFAQLGDGGARTLARLSLALVFIVVEWSKDQFINFYYFCIFNSTIDDYQ
jgi:hypothetical protein